MTHPTVIEKLNVFLNSHSFKNPNNAKYWTFQLNSVAKLTRLHDNVIKGASFYLVCGDFCLTVSLATIFITVHAPLMLQVSI